MSLNHLCIIMNLSNGKSSPLPTYLSIYLPTYQPTYPPYKSISMSLDQKDRERELVSKLLSGLYPDVLTTEDIGKGFERLFEIVDDLALDAPR